MSFFWIAILLLPLLAVLIDGFAGIRARGRSYEFGAQAIESFRILVPIWGRTAYLQNVTYLSQYGQRVTLCTTGNETAEFYAELGDIAKNHGFRIFVDRPQSGTHSRSQMNRRRTTGGTIRDRLIRNALSTVTEPYVVPLDADTITCQPISSLVGELVIQNLDIASIRLVLNNPDDSLLTKLQRLEYRLAMQMRFLAPWMVSGACQVAKTEVMRDVMDHHSLFFQGNDVEIGVIAKDRGYRIGHIPFEVVTDVPSGLLPWFRQRLAWAGGEFRLFIVNGWLIVRHPFFWIYGGLVAIVGLFFRWWALTEPGYSLITALVLYVALAVYVHWRAKNKWLLIMPFYTFVSSMILTPLGIIWYFKMALEGGNWGIIRPHRETPVA
jgi:hypothetical protein